MLLVTMNAMIHRHQRNRGRGLHSLLLKHEHAIDCTYEEWRVVPLSESTPSFSEFPNKLRDGVAKRRLLAWWVVCEAAPIEVKAAAAWATAQERLPLAGVRDACAEAVTRLPFPFILLLGTMGKAQLWEKVCCYNFQNPFAYRHKRPPEAEASGSNRQPKVEPTAKNGNSTGTNSAHTVKKGFKFVASTKFFSILRKVFVSKQVPNCIKKNDYGGNRLQNTICLYTISLTYANSNDLKKPTTSIHCN